MSARSDQSLSAAECDGLSYAVRGGEEREERDEVDAAVIISDKLKVLCTYIVKTLENDSEINEQDENVIGRALPDGSTVNLQPIQQHLMHILQNFFSSEAVQNCMLIEL